MRLGPGSVAWGGPAYYGGGAAGPGGDAVRAVQGMMKRLVIIGAAGLLVLVAAVMFGYRQGYIGAGGRGASETAGPPPLEAPPEGALPKPDQGQPEETAKATPAPAPEATPETAPETAAEAAPEKPKATAETIPSFDVVRIDPKGNAVMAGRAAPGADVSILNKGQEIGHAKADANGEWVWVPEAPLKPGSLELGLTAEVPGKGKVDSKNSVVLVVPEPHKDIAGREGGEKGALVLKVPNKGGVSEVVQTPSNPGAPSNVQAGGLTLDVVDYDDKGKLALGGRAHANAHLRVYLDNGLLGETTTAQSGRWMLRPDRPVAPGSYRLRVDSIGPNGKGIARIELPFTRSEKVASANRAPQLRQRDPVHGHLRGE